MTKEELAERHMIQFRTALPGADIYKDMADISIEYAISVLEETRQNIISDSKEEDPLSPVVRLDVTIRELQSLIK